MRSRRIWLGLSGPPRRCHIVNRPRRQPLGVSGDLSDQQAHEDVQAQHLEFHLRRWRSGPSGARLFGDAARTHRSADKLGVVTRSNLDRQSLLRCVARTSNSPRARPLSPNCALACAGGKKPWRTKNRCGLYFAFMNASGFSHPPTQCLATLEAKRRCLVPGLSKAQCAQCKKRGQKNSCTWKSHHHVPTIHSCPEADTTARWPVF